MFASLNYFWQIFLIDLPIFGAGLFFIFSIKKDWFQKLKKPIDFGLRLNGKRILGQNKTFRGVVIMSLAAVSIALAVSMIMEFFRIDFSATVYDYHFSSWWKTLLYGLAYPVGELPNSFIKRRLDICSGEKSFKPFIKAFFSILDKIDSLVICFLVLIFIFRLELAYALGAFFLGWILHYLTDLLMIFSSLKKAA